MLPKNRGNISKESYNPVISALLEVDSFPKDTPMMYVSSSSMTGPLATAVF